MKSITISINQMGAPKIEANGFNGVGCTEATAPLERALSGGDPSENTRELKPEWYENNEEEATIKW